MSPESRTMHLIDRLLEKGLLLEERSNGWTLYGESEPDVNVRHDIHVAIGSLELQFRQMDSKSLQIKIAEHRRTHSDQMLTRLGSEVTGGRLEQDAWLDITSPDDEPIVRLFDSLLSTAMSRNASDIHIDLEANGICVRFRIDGVLTEYIRLPKHVMLPLLGRLKIVAAMDITERRRPQDGAFSFPGEPPVDIRVATLPGVRSERAVLRIFQSITTRIALDSLGISVAQTGGLRRALAAQAGLILICGPTGSGKTTTIYSVLETLKGRGLNIMTIEDPVEVELDGVVQSQVNQAIGYDFHTGLRALLRQDPDVILVGEIRDQQTADAAIRAALTGHLVIATVHANSVMGAVNRLINLGVDCSLVADALVGIFNQRLVRTYCPNCAANSVESAGHMAAMPVLFDGCEMCFATGFQGRLPVMEHVIIGLNEREGLMESTVISKPEESLFEAATDLFQNQRIPWFEVCRVGGSDTDAVSI